jgi:hypothetical protein
VSLEAELQEYRRQIVTDAYPMSIGELVNLYRDGELDIHPEFQRIFRWTDGQKTRLIESILLGIPLPSIFVAQNEEGVWDVVDGVQRISTIFQFMGVLKDEDQAPVPAFVTKAAPFLLSMEGMSYESGTDGSTTSLDPAQRLDFKRARVDVKIIKRESDRRAKYDLFQRLNSYGSVATEQELRNCLLVSMSRDHYKWLEDIAESSAFREVVDLPDRLIDERYHAELALRFITLRDIPESDLSRVGNIGEFLTGELLAFVERDAQWLETERKIFTETFELLKAAGSSPILRKWSVANARTEGSFSLTAFEAIALGIGHYNAAGRITPDTVDKKRKELWSSPLQAASSFQRVDHRGGVRREDPPQPGSPKAGTSTPPNSAHIISAQHSTLGVDDAFSCRARIRPLGGLREGCEPGVCAHY